MDDGTSAVVVVVAFIVIGIVAYIWDFIITRGQALERVKSLEKNNNELSAKCYALSKQCQELKSAIESAQSIVLPFL
jgi:septation ring formation regulator EzrA